MIIDFLMTYHSLQLILNAFCPQNPQTKSCLVNYSEQPYFFRSTHSAKQFNSNTSENESRAKAVAVILGYFNGNRYLPEQLDSILNQSHSNLKIFISDDHSDQTLSLEALELEADDLDKISLRRNKSNVGFINNFLGTLANVHDQFEYYAFSDQDDIWNPQKIASAIKILSQYPDNQPALYCARTTITDEHCQAELGTSPLFSKAPSFANALVQNIGGGNTMVFNKAARNIIVKSTKNVDVVSHDWWCYQIISGANGIVHYDPEPRLKYRQHSQNLVGSNNNWGARIVRFNGMLKGKFRNWNDINLIALAKNRSLLTSVNQKRLDDFIEARQSGLLKRLFLSKRAGVYRQTFLGNIGLFLGLIINKV